MKPKIKLVGENGNIYNLVGIAERALKRDGQKENAKAMVDEVFGASSYDAALRVIMKYCDVS